MKGRAKAPQANGRSWRHKCCKRGHIPHPDLQPETGVNGEGWAIMTWLCGDCGAAFGKVVGKTSALSGPGGERIVQ
jgi:hypothetical protein